MLPLTTLLFSPSRFYALKHSLYTFFFLLFINVESKQCRYKVSNYSDVDMQTRHMFSETLLHGRSLLTDVVQYISVVLHIHPVHTKVIGIYRNTYYCGIMTCTMHCHPMDAHVSWLRKLLTRTYGGNTYARSMLADLPIQ